MTSARLTLNLTVYTTDGDPTVHRYDWPDDPERQVELRRDLTRRVQAGFLDPVIGLFSFEHPSVLYNPSQMVRIVMEVSGPEERASEVEEANRQIGFVQNQPGRGQAQ